MHLCGFKALFIYRVDNVVNNNLIDRVVISEDHYDQWLSEVRAWVVSYRQHGLPVPPLSEEVAIKMPGNVLKLCFNSVETPSYTVPFGYWSAKSPALSLMAKRSF